MPGRVRQTRTDLKSQIHQRRHNEADPEAVHQAQPDQPTAQTLERFERKGLHRGPPSVDALSRRLWYSSSNKRI